MAYYLWLITYGLLPMVYYLWLITYGLLPMAYYNLCKIIVFLVHVVSCSYCTIICTVLIVIKLIIAVDRLSIIISVKYSIQQTPSCKKANFQMSAIVRNQTSPKSLFLYGDIIVEAVKYIVTRSCVPPLNFLYDANEASLLSRKDKTLSLMFRELFRNVIRAIWALGLNNTKLSSFVSVNGYGAICDHALMLFFKAQRSEYSVTKLKGIRRLVVSKRMSGAFHC
jgi:hypothetical protein